MMLSGFRRLTVALWLPLFGLIGPHADVSAQTRGRAPAAAGEAPAPTGSRGENFSSKPAAALFSSDCSGAGCHKGPQGLGKEMSQGGLADFLREHYTNSRESAAALAAYLRNAPAGKPQMTPATPDRAERPAAPRGRAAVRTEEPKPGEAKPAEAKPGEEEGAAAPKPPRRATRETPPIPPADILREEGAKDGAKDGAKEEGAKDGIKETAKPEPRKPLPKPAPRARQVTATPAAPVTPAPAAAPEPPLPPPPPPAPKQYDIFD